MGKLQMDRASDILSLTDTRLVVPRLIPGGRNAVEPT